MMRSYLRIAECASTCALPNVQVCAQHGCWDEVDAVVYFWVRRSRTEPGKPGRHLAFG